MLHTELRTRLDARVLAEVLELIEETTRLEGHRPVGEHKYEHLRVGAANWVGVLAYDDRRLVGYAHTRWNPPGRRPRAAVEVVVHPDHRDSGIARQLLEETRGVLAHAGGGLLYLWVHRVKDPATALAIQMGFTIERDLAFMTRPLTRRPTARPLPDGMTLRTYRGARDDREFLRVNNAAFADHPENGGWDLAEFADRRARDWFEEGGLLMAWRATPDGTEDLAGFHWTKYHGHESEELPAHEPVGEVYVLAVAQDAQGRGLGRTLLEAGLAHLYDRGCRLAVLYVDRADAPAVTLYEKTGFQVAYSEVCYSDRVEPAAAGADLTRPAG